MCEHLLLMLLYSYIQLMYQIKFKFRMNQAKEPFYTVHNDHRWQVKLEYVKNWRHEILKP